MQQATFKKMYVTSTVFNGMSMAQMLESSHVVITDKTVLEKIRPLSETRNFVDIFNFDGYSMTYHGKDNLGSHIFKISNSVHLIEMQMSDEQFRVYFDVIE